VAYLSHKLERSIEMNKEKLRFVAEVCGFIGLVFYAVHVAINFQLEEPQEAKKAKEGCSCGK